jgi:hypothetical protein
MRFSPAVAPRRSIEAPPRQDNGPAGRLRPTSAAPVWRGAWAWWQIWTRQQAWAWQQPWTRQQAGTYQSALALALVMCAGLGGCQKTSGPAAAAPPEVEGGALVGKAIVVLTNTYLRLAPSDDNRVPHPRDPSQTVDNYIGLLARTKKGRVTQARPGWVEVKLSDSAEGWVHMADVMPSARVSEFTVLEAVSYYSRPDSEQPAGQLPPGELLYVEAKDPKQGRARVQAEQVGTVYVEPQALSGDPHELAVSRGIIHARSSARMQDLTEAIEVLDDARLDHPQATLINLLAEQVNFLKMHRVPRHNTSHIGMPQ